MTQTTELGPFDLDGNERFVGTVDMGAYEFDSTAPAAQTEIAIVSDPAGNLVFDGSYHYMYDGWNRLVQINEPGTISLDATGRISSGVLGNLVSRYTYDGLGRLIQKIEPKSRQDGRLRTEDYYYDGARRIQEVVTNPAGSSGPTFDTWREREYVYGPEYVDEFVLQIDKDGDPYYVLQDDSEGTPDAAVFGNNWNRIWPVNKSSDVNKTTPPAPAPAEEPRH